MPHTRPDLSVSNAIYFSSGRRNKLWATCVVAIYSCCTRKYKRLFSIQTTIFCPSPESYIRTLLYVRTSKSFLAPHHLEIIVKFPPRFFSLIILSVLQQYLLKQQSSNQRSSLCP